MAVVAAFDTVALAGMIPHNMTTAKTADIILLTFFFTLLYLFSVFVRLLRPSSLRWSTFEFIHKVLLSLTTSPRLDILSKRLQKKKPFSFLLTKGLFPISIYYLIVQNNLIDSIFFNSYLNSLCFLISIWYNSLIKHITFSNFQINHFSF